MHFSFSPRSLTALLIIIIAATGIAVAILRLPAATITIYPATHDRFVTQEITLSSTTTEPDFVRFILPAKFAEVETEVSKTVSRESGNTFDDFARGTVTMINNEDEEQRLLPKTHLRHADTGIFFLTDAPVVIPPKATTTVGVTAKEKGASGNVAAGKFIIDKLAASLQDQIYAQSAAPFSGGVSTDTPVSETEISQAKAAVVAEAKAKAKAELSTKVGGVEINDALLALDVIEENVSVTPGSHATGFSVVTKVRGRGFFPDANDVLSLTLLALRSSPKADEEFISFQPESFRLEIIRSDFSRGEARVKGTLSGTFAQKTGPNVFTADNLAGRSEPEVQEYFKQFPSVSRAEVSFSPFWVKTVPARREATTIEIKNAQ